MNSKITYKATARTDIDEQSQYIGLRNPQAGERFYVACQRAIEQLAAGPLMGSPCDLDHPRLSGLRTWTIQEFRNDVIYYRPEPDGVTVVRVLHGARDAEAILGGDEG